MRKPIVIMSNTSLEKDILALERRTKEVTQVGLKAKYFASASILEVQLIYTDSFSDPQRKDLYVRLQTIKQRCAI